MISNPWCSDFVEIVPAVLIQAIVLSTSSIQNTYNGFADMGFTNILYS